MNLYEIAKLYQDFFEAVEQGEVPDEAFKDTFEGLQGMADEKIDNSACYIKSAYAEAEALRTEAKSLLERAKAKEAAADRFKDYLSKKLPELGYGKSKKFESIRNRISFRTSKAVVIPDEFSFATWATHHADDLITYKTPTPNKTAIKDAIAAGREVVGAYIEERESLIIK